MELSVFTALESLNQTQLENLTNACEEISVAKGEVLIQGGEPGGNMYFLLEGSLVVYVGGGDERETELVRLDAPAIVGEMELLTGQKSTASARTTCDCRLMSVSHESIQARLDDADPAAMKVMLSVSRMIAGRLVDLTTKFVEIEGKIDTQGSRELSNFRKKLFSEWTI